MNAKIDAFLSKAKKWQDEMTQLRVIALDCGLTEELKWGKPCYAFHKKNIVIIQGFKEYCALLFFKGYLLDDPNDILKKTGPNTRVGRQIRFTSAREIGKIKSVLKAYIYQAIEVEKSGANAPVQKNEPSIPEEFKKYLEKSVALKTAFKALTPGRQRAYLHYFSSAKLTKTRESRIEKSVKVILKGKGLND